MPTPYLGNQYTTADDIEQTVNTSTFGEEIYPQVTALDGGGWVVTWQEYWSADIFAQMYDASGVKIGGEITVTTYGINPQIAGLDGGGFVVSYMNYDSTSYTHSSYAQIFDDTGMAVGGEITLDSDPVSNCLEPLVVALDSGGFMAVWQSSNTLAHANSYETGIVGRIFDASGTAVTSDFTIGAKLDGSDPQTFPAVTKLSDGNVMVVWHNFAIGGTPWNAGYVGQLMDQSGNLIGSQMVLDMGYANGTPNVTALDGGFAFTWIGDSSSHTSAEIYVSLYDNDGTARTLNIGVDSYNYQTQISPSTVALDDGGFVVFWSSSSLPDVVTGESWGIAGQRFDEDGDKIGGEFIVNTYNGVSPYATPSATLSDDGQLVIVWTSQGSPDDDEMYPWTSPTNGISMQILDPSGTVHGEPQWVGNADLTPIGDEARINDSVVGGADFQTIDSFDNGDILVGFHSGALGLAVKIYNADGTVQQSDTSLMAPSVTNYGYGQFAVLQGQDFVTTWLDYDYGIGRYQLYGQVYDTDLNTVGSQFTISSGVNSASPLQTIAMSNGNILVSWFEFDSVYTREYTATGTAVSGANVIYSSPGNYITGNFHLAQNANGNFLLTYDGDAGVKAVLLDDDGATALNSPVHLTGSANFYSRGESTALANGNFAVTWAVMGGTAYEIQQVDTSGNLVGSPYVLETNMTAPYILNPDIVALPDGSYLAFGISNGGPDRVIGFWEDSRGVVGQRIGVNNVPIGDPFMVSTFTLGTPSNYYSTSSDWDANTGIVTVTWSGLGAPGQNVLAPGMSGPYMGLSKQQFQLDVTTNLPIIGTSGADNLIGRFGYDSITGGAGNDTIVSGRNNDAIFGGAGNDSIRGELDNDLIYGDADNDTIYGDEGNDTISGGTGTDSLLGGDGNDSINGDDGNDTINGGDGADVLNGGNNNDSILGGAGNDSIDGGVGTDTMLGGAGDDTYTVNATADVITESASEGTDLVLAAATYTLSANVENLTLTGSGNINATGNTGNNVLTGNSGNNTLNGGTGNDTMIGGLGNDIYVVNAVGDLVTENASAGTDTVQSSIAYTLGTNLENLTLTGSSHINGTGNSANNSLTGNTGNNTLDGGAGNDTMAGGAGNDTYVVDATGDVVTEGLSAGTDLVQSSVSYTLSANVENITLTGSSSINATGNTLNNVLTGNAGDNTLDGGTGNDTMVGGTGNDTYIVDSASDVVTEGSAAGTDTVQTSVSLTLVANVENLTLTGSASINATGNALNNVITGNSGDNVIYGGSGIDMLTSGSGADIFDFNAISDSGVGSGNRDVISDFQQGADKIDLSTIGSFTWLGTSAFTATSVAETMYYDASGHTILAIDQNGDGIADLEIDFTTTYTLSSGDLI